MILKLKQQWPKIKPKRGTNLVVPNADRATLSKISERLAILKALLPRHRPPVRQEAVVLPAAALLIRRLVIGCV